MNKGWIIRECRKEDAEKLFELHRAVHPSSKVDYEDWVKAWNEESKKRVWICEKDGKIIGQEQMLTMRLKVGDKVLDVTQSMGSMTHPNYRHQGIFSAMVRQAHTDLYRQGIPLVIGLPNWMSYSGFIKLGWLPVARMKVMLKPINYMNTMKLKVNNKYLRFILAMAAGIICKLLSLPTRKAIYSGYNVRNIESFDDRFDILWNKVSSQYKIMVVKDKEYLNNRYSHPNNDYVKFVVERNGEINGFVVLRHTDLRTVKVGFIVDIIAQSGEAMDTLLNSAVKNCYTKGDDAVIYNAIANKNYEKIFKRNGFISLPFIKGECFCAYSVNDAVPKELLVNPENWLVHIGDSDAI